MDHQSTQAPSPSLTVVTSTSLTTFVTFNGPNRQESTVVSTHIFTTTQPIAAPAASGNATQTQNSNSTAAAPSGNATSSRTSSVNLPTAPTDVNGGGGTAGAPVPGATGNNGAYGPDDGYIAAAMALKRNAMLVGISGLLVGGALTVL